MNATLSSRMTARIVAACAAVAVTIASSGLAHAEDPTDYCRRVMAHADGDAAQLFAPTAHLQVVKFPQNSPADTAGVQIGDGLQPRAALSIGLVDIYKGFGVKQWAASECRRQESAVTLEAVLATRAEIGRAPALERKVAFLRAHEAEVKAIVKNAEERLAAHTNTISEVQDLRLRALGFTRRVAESEAELARVKSRAVTVPTEPLAKLLVTYEERNLQLEKSNSHLRNLQPWKLNVTGGVAATPSAQVYGVAELSYNFGGIFVPSAESRANQARASELKNARYEMRQQVDALTRDLRTSAEHSREQARAIEEELARLSKDRASLDGTEAPNKHTVLAAMTLAMVDLEAEHTFLTVLAENQGAVVGAK